MNVLTGLIFHFIGGFASGSFYIPYKKVKGWHWESYWIVGGFFSWLIVPPLAAWLTIPHFGEIISKTDPSVIGYTFLFCLLWGIGGLTYGLGVRWLGVSLGSSIILGLCMVFGSLIPALYYNWHPVAGKDTLDMMAGSTWGRTVLFGLLICVVGIAIGAKAGMMKEKQVNAPGADPHGASVEGNDYHFGLGMVVAIVSGVLSACFNFGLEAGQSMASVANEAWKAANPGQGEFLYRNNLIYVVLLWGGLTTNFIWCMVLNARNKSFGDYTNSKTPLLANYIFAALAGTTWFLQFFFYGMGESRLGNGPSSWILHMSFIILVANLWGLVLKEWKGVGRKTVITNVAGIALIILSVLVVGYGNSLK
jgi:L-rhamnose-H+ transport protein